SGGLLFREKIKEWITWRKLFEEDFSYAHTRELATNWHAVRSADWWNMTPEPFSDSGGWRIEDSSLHGYNIEGFHNITYRHKLRGDIRVEWEVTPLRLNINLNSFIAGEHRFGGYTFHIGSFGSPHTFVLTRGSSDHMVDHLEYEDGIELGRTYRFRMEKEGKHVRLFMDGRKLFDYKDPEPYAGTGHQTFGFENNMGNHVRIDNVVVYHHPLPLKASPLIAADRFLERGHYAEALEEYRELIEVYPDHEIAIIAQLKSARCLVQLDSIGEAIRTLTVLERQHPKHELAAVAGYERARLLEQSGDSTAALDVYLSLAERFPGHSVLRAAFFEITTDRYAAMRQMKQTFVADSSSDGHFPRWLEREVRNLQRLADAFAVSLQGNRFMHAAAEEYVHACQADPEDVMRLFPGQRTMLAEAYLTYHQFERVLDEFSELDEPAAHALHRLGKYREILERYPQQREWVAWSLLRLGEYDRLLAQMPDRTEPCAIAMRLKGEFERLFEEYRPNVPVWMEAARDLGTCTERLTLPGLSRYERARILVDALGRPDSALSVLLPYEWARFDYELLVANAFHKAGMPDSVIARFGASASFEEVCSDALLSLGRSEDALARYPFFDAIQASALRERGEFDAITRRYPHLRVYTIEARWSSGLTDELLSDYERRDSLCALILLATGQLDRVLSMYPDQRVPYTEALLLRGQYDELLRDYPDQRMACARALYAQNLPDSAIARYPESRAFHAQWLIDKGRHEEVVVRYRDQAREYALALAMLGRYDEIPYRRELPGVSLTTHCDMLHLRALHAAVAGQTASVDRILARPHPVNYKSEFGQLRFGVFLLGPITHALTGDSARLVHDCARIMENRQYMYGQRLWYEAAYLSHRVGDKDFLAQPYGFRAPQRLLLVRAIRNDIAGNHPEALRDYQAWAEIPNYPLPEKLSDLRDSETVKQFVQWRLGVCRAAAPGGAVQRQSAQPAG
ncbi:MAG: tetratricopeptide repeat protein, partial [Chitinivibrionales bacterium]|nr:tetratricopeptide repeat protein [Chitinivibrionales bacterium]